MSDARCPMLTCAMLPTRYSMPLADVCQDWVLLSGSKEGMSILASAMRSPIMTEFVRLPGGKIIVEATRPLRTDDNEVPVDVCAKRCAVLTRHGCQDWELADDSEFQQGHAFIAAWSAPLKNQARDQRYPALIEHLALPGEIRKRYPTTEQRGPRVASPSPSACAI